MSGITDLECTNPVYLALRRIYCTKGAEFCRPDLEAAWVEIARLEAILKREDICPCCGENDASRFCVCGESIIEPAHNRA